ncbi:hypothetical protein BS35_002526 [Actinomadura glauciflava]|uniref:hypothetical protein n=1 Tax=Actinomadura luteofluorescens TaxID=46163 RepID=UPI002164D8D3|nr:hypothetical protein [Actinomadura glauciflava]MCR3739973.1 hypothetical protein [Actinomadura glauciflava]
MDAVVGTAWACVRLERSFFVSGWAHTRRSLSRRSRATTMEAFLLEELRAAMSGVPAHDPRMALSAALHRATLSSLREARELIENAMRLTAPLWEHGRVKQGDNVLAVTSLLAAILINREDRSDEKLAGQSSDALTALVALTPNAGPPAADPTPMDKLLVLVRA